METPFFELFFLENRTPAKADLACPSETSELASRLAASFAMETVVVSTFGPTVRNESRVT